MLLKIRGEIRLSLIYIKRLQTVLKRVELIFYPHL